MWIIAALAGLFILVIFVLSVPFESTLSLEVYGRPRFRLKVGWFFGLVSKEVGGGKKSEEEEKPADRKRGFDRAQLVRMAGILRIPGLSKRVRAFLRSIVNRLKIRDFGADLRVGLGDPADTALLFAIIGPATAFLGSSQLHQIRLQPSFGDDAVLEGYSRVTVRLRPIRLVSPFPKFVFSLTALRIIKVLILSKWKRKK